MNISTIGIILAVFFSNCILIVLSKNYFKKKINQIQDIHYGFVPRVGGISLFLFILLFLLSSNNLHLLIYFFFGFFILFPAFIEDLGYELSPIIRFFSILFGSFLIIQSIGILPELNHLAFLNNHFFKILFFTLGVATIINGQNMIDGVNGLSIIVGIMIFICLYKIGIKFDDNYLKSISQFLIICLFVIFIFNYPFGFLFLGDLGSYLIGLLASVLVIITYAKYPELSIWSAFSILFYPFIEVVFSFIRKIINKNSPFEPDKDHLHILIFQIFLKITNKRQLSNNLVLPFLSMIWIPIIFLIDYILYSTVLSLLTLICLILIYLLTYFISIKFYNLNTK